MENSYSLEMDILLWSILPSMVIYLPRGFLAGSFIFLPNFKPRGAGKESIYYGINNKRPAKSERGNQDLQNPQVWCCSVLY